MSLKLPVRKQHKTGITVLIDADVVSYSCGFASQKNIYTLTVKGEEEPRSTFQYKKDLNEWVKERGFTEEDYTVDTRLEVEPVSNALHSARMMIEDIIEVCQAENYQLYLTGKGNFREQVATIQPYKGNRTADKPVHHQAIRDYLISQWGAEVIEGMEADDVLAMRQTDTTVIASIDKDLKQVKGKHYNWRTDDCPTHVTEEVGTYNFYYQLLVGDRTDNIPGIPGMGPVKAKKLLELCDDEEDMYWETLCQYSMKYEKPFEALLENAYLLWMVRELDEDGQPVMWSPKW